MTDHIGSDRPDGPGPDNRPAPAHGAVRSVQGTVASFDVAGQHGSALLDDGTPVPIPASAFQASGLRLLRVGQRVRIERKPVPDNGDGTDNEGRTYDGCIVVRVSLITIS